MSAYADITNYEGQLLRVYGTFTAADQDFHSKLN